MDKTKQTAKNIVYWSPSLKELRGVIQAPVIKNKARMFLQKGLVSYDKRSKVFKVKPIPGYNKTTYTISNRGDKHFQCNCQFYNTTGKKWAHPVCSHIQAVKFYLEVKRTKNKSAKLSN